MYLKSVLGECDITALQISKLASCYTSKDRRNAVQTAPVLVETDLSHSFLIHSALIVIIMHQHTIS